MWSCGATLGCRYELEEQIGAGGFSDVWRARDLLLGRLVAVKVLHAGYVEHPEALARFRAEARHAGGLAHENIARVYDYGEAGPPYLVMELADGPSLAGELAGGPVGPARAMDVVAQTAAGLQAAHLAGLVHRDIKPGNLLLTRDGIVKITDFGISHAVGSARVTSTGLVVGTPGYLAPERAAGASATAASDLYSLGVVAYECLTGAAPFSGTALEVAVAHASRPFPALPAFVPADVAALVRDLTAKDPAARPGSAGEAGRRAGQLGHRQTANPRRAAGQPAIPPADQAPAPGVATTRMTRWHPGRLSLPPAVAAAGAAIALVVPVALVLASAGSPHPARHPAAVASPGAAGTSPSVLTVDVNAGSLVGQPVGAAARQLRQRGLIPRVRWQASSQQPPGRVLAIRPAGARPAGSVVNVIGALQVPASATASHPVGQSHGKGHGDGDGGGKGGGGGDG